VGAQKVLEAHRLPQPSLHCNSVIYSAFGAVFGFKTTVLGTALQAFVCFLQHCCRTHTAPTERRTRTSSPKRSTVLQAPTGFQVLYYKPAERYKATVINKYLP
jgi:hypothetical protein